MNWITKILPTKVGVKSKHVVPEGVWTKCVGCHSVLYGNELIRNLEVCPKCKYHHKISARRRLLAFLDKNTHNELATEIVPVDLLKFKDSKRYKDRLLAAQKSTGERDALVVMSGSLCSIPVIVAGFEFDFIGGSMGSVVGEKFVQAVNAAINQGCAFICFCTSGGARMQEGLFSLLQMAKTSAALAKLAEAKLPYISVLTDPTMGGVSASLATLGDVIIAEPNALIGFAGPRVIAQTVKEILPDGFQRSEFLLEHGAIDMIVDRHNLRTVVASLVAKLTHQPHPHVVEKSE